MFPEGNNPPKLVGGQNLKDAGVLLVSVKDKNKAPAFCFIGRQRERKHNEKDRVRYQVREIERIS